MPPTSYRLDLDDVNGEVIALRWTASGAAAPPGGRVACALKHAVARARQNINVGFEGESKAAAAAAAPETAAAAAPPLTAPATAAAGSAAGAGEGGEALSELAVEWGVEAAEIEEEEALDNFVAEPVMDAVLSGRKQHHAKPTQCRC